MNTGTIIAALVLPLILIYVLSVNKDCTDIGGVTVVGLGQYHCVKEIK